MRLLPYQRVLGEHLYAICWIRYAIALTLALGAWIGDDLPGVYVLNRGGLFAVALAIFLYDTVILYLVAPARKSENAAGGIWRHLWIVHAGAVLLDYATLTLTIWLLGGLGSPLQSVYLLHVILTALMLSGRTSW